MERKQCPLPAPERRSQLSEALRFAAGGCEPVIVGSLANSHSFQRAAPGYLANTTTPELRRLLTLPPQA